MSECHTRNVQVSTENKALSSCWMVLAPHTVCFALPPLTVAFSQTVLTVGELSTYVTAGSAVASAAGFGLWWALCGRHTKGWREPALALAIAAGSFGASQAIHGHNTGHHSEYAVSDAGHAWYQSLTEQDQIRIQTYAADNDMTLPQSINELKMFSSAMCSTSNGNADTQPALFIP